MTTAKQVWIAAAATILSAIITGFFTLSSTPTTQQETACGSAVANVEGNVTINSDQSCDLEGQ
ncbi:hypothetical protein [Amphritea balenae]|uniref:Uncharacterized protein n=1 Tax=Amphritea balenae TaxID=452629 RepID=A0A3P1SP61_9GAMM|nr:hypothetical protein [Amphritea balenae]RRC98850.1 hypothetical protein EHS89_11715 [Amphritea balenae]GGK62296.1 hypothetical protein GCM10007941_10490 [Amphritea balenae]